MDLDGIKNIIFDLGGVIINLDQDATTKAFHKLMGNHYKDLEKEVMSKKILDKFETNEYTADMFIDIFRSYQPTIKNNQVIKAWNTMLLDIPVERIHLIQKLRTKYKVFLLSNTNQIHLDYIHQYVKKQFDLDSLSTLFEKTFYSHKLGLRKPDSSIFLKIIEEQKLIPEETLFIDDAEQHILTANQLNLKTYHLVKPETILDLFHVD